jgi:hypothetical protein
MHTFCACLDGATARTTAASSATMRTGEVRAGCCCHGPELSSLASCPARLAVPGFDLLWPVTFFHTVFNRSHHSTCARSSRLWCTKANQITSTTHAMHEQFVSATSTHIHQHQQHQTTNTVTMTTIQGCFHTWLVDGLQPATWAMQKATSCGSFTPCCQGALPDASCQVQRSSPLNKFTATSPVYSPQQQCLYYIPPWGAFPERTKPTEHQHTLSWLWLGIDHALT